MDSLQALAAIAHNLEHGAHDFGALIYQRSGSSRTATSITTPDRLTFVSPYETRWHDRRGALPSIAEAAYEM